MEKGFAHIIAPLLITLGVGLIGFIILIGFPEDTKCGEVLSCHGIPFKGDCLGYKSLFANIDCPYTGSISPPPSPIPSSDQTSNWKTYTNTDFSFSIQYPPDWFAKRDDNSWNKNKEYLLLVEKGVEPAFLPPLTDHLSVFNIRVSKYQFNKKDLEKTGTTENPADQNIPANNRNVYMPITFLGMPANQRIQQTGGVSGFYPETEIKFNAHGFAWDITYPNLDGTGKHDKIYDQILSTFKFMDQNQTTDTSNWKTYTGTKYLVKYPAEWSYLIKDLTKQDQCGYFGKDQDLKPETTLNNTITVCYLESELPADSSSDTNLVAMTLNGYTGKKGTREDPPGFTRNIVVLKDPFRTKGYVELANTHPEDPKFNSTFDQMLSTFKFTNPPQSINVDSWKTYTNPTYKYSIQFPDGYEVPAQSDRQKSQLGVDTNMCVTEKSTTKCIVVIDYSQMSLDEVLKMRAPTDKSEAQDYSVGNIKGKMYVYKMGESTTEVLILIPVKNGVISLSYSNYPADVEGSKLKEQTVSTFKFTK